MLSAVAKKLVHHSQLNWDKQFCLRNRLRGFSCRRCVEVCTHQAFTEIEGEIHYSQEQCTGCGSCVAACHNDSFSFEGVDLQAEMENRLHEPNLVVSCHRCDHISENEVRLPCVGILSEEYLVYLGCVRQSDTLINLTRCEECHNSGASEVFQKKLKQVQKKVGHLFRTRFMAVHSQDNLPCSRQSDRRKFLFSLGNNAADILVSQLGPVTAQSTDAKKGRRVPARIRLILKLLQENGFKDYGVTETCSPSIEISHKCTLCPRCTGMCPTGALKVHKTQGDKVLSFNGHLCSGCELCMEFCKEKAITIRQPTIRVDTASFKSAVPTDPTL